MILKLSANHGGYPVLFRMALDDRINHILFIQIGSVIIIRNKNVQESTDKKMVTARCC